MLFNLSGSLLLAAALVASPAAAQSDAAAAAWRAGDHRLAAELYEARVRADSGDVAALQRLALLRAWSGRHAEALRLVDRWIALQPENLEARSDRARVLALAGRYDDAQAAYEAVLARRPGDPGALTGLARITAWRGDLVAAEAQWRTVLDRAPDDAEALIGLAQTLRWQGRDAAAAPLLDRVLATDPANRDAREELLSLNVALRPRVLPRAVHERDSDGNRITTIAAGVGGRVRTRTELRADAYVRAARLRSQPLLDASAYGGTATLWHQLEPGWTLAASGGLASATAEEAEVLPILGASVTTPARYRAVLAVSAAHAPFDATSVLMQRRVVVSELSGALTSTHIRPATLRANASVARFEGRAAGLRNTRVAGGASLAVPAGPVRLALQARAFGFERTDIFDGYFAPDFYGLVEAAAQYTTARAAWSWLLELAPGLQQVTSDGTAKGSLRGTTELSYVPRPGRSIVLGVNYASAGVNALSPDAGSSYRYRSVSLSARWGL